MDSLALDRFGKTVITGAYDHAVTRPQLCDIVAGCVRNPNALAVERNAARCVANREVTNYRCLIPAEQRNLQRIEKLSRNQLLTGQRRFARNR